MQVLLHRNDWLDLHSAALVCNVVCRAAARNAVNSPPPAQLRGQKADIDIAAQRWVFYFTISLDIPNRIESDIFRKIYTLARIVPTPVAGQGWC